ncbi:MAG: DUF1990 family protein [Acidimicrobiales bacterium]
MHPSTPSGDATASGSCCPKRTRRRDRHRSPDRFRRAGPRDPGGLVPPSNAITKRPRLVGGQQTGLPVSYQPVSFQPVGATWVTATCRIVGVLDEPHRFGFAYGTLAHHPACGEECFTVTYDPATEEVRVRVVAVSRPSWFEDREQGGLTIAQVRG